MKLLCFPYAGGSALIYKARLKDYLNDKIEIVQIELPGRGKRFNEKLKSDFHELMQDLIPQIYNAIFDGSDYALLGYSMGSRIIYELYYEILSRNWKQPEMLFFCAANPPAIHYETNTSNDEAILKEMKILGGTDKDVLENNELMYIFIPIMRADMEVLKSYNYMEHSQKIAVPIVIQYGIHDTDVVKHVKEWADYTLYQCEFIEYDDGHFFIHSYFKEMAEVLNSRLI